MLAQELRDLGARDVTVVSGGALFGADAALACRATFWLRSAVRVLARVVSGRVGDFDQLYELLGEVYALDDYKTPSADLVAHLQAIIDEAFGRGGETASSVK